MDIAVHWGVLRHLRRDIGASAAVLVTAIALDGVVLAPFLAIKGQADPTIVVVALAGIALIVLGERLFLRNRERSPAAQ